MWPEDILEELLKRGPLSTATLYKAFRHAEDVDEVLRNLTRSNMIRQNKEGKWDFTRTGLYRLKESGYGRREDWASFAVDSWREE